MNDNDLRQILVNSLYTLAKITGGYSTVTNKKGMRIKTVDSFGKEIVNLKGVLKNIKELAMLAAKSHSYVLIYGETGTGKELFARASSIHKRGYSLDNRSFHKKDEHNVWQACERHRQFSH